MDRSKLDRLDWSRLVFQSSPVPNIKGPIPPVWSISKINGQVDQTVHTPNEKAQCFERWQLRWICEIGERLGVKLRKLVIISFLVVILINAPFHIFFFKYFTFFKKNGGLNLLFNYKLENLHPKLPLVRFKPGNSPWSEWTHFQLGYHICSNTLISLHQITNFHLFFFLFINRPTGHLHLNRSFGLRKRNEKKKKYVYEGEYKWNGRRERGCRAGLVV